MGRSVPSKLAPGVYRDEPDRDDAASTSSAVFLEDIDQLEAGLPAYEDVVAQERSKPYPGDEHEPKA